MTFRLTYGVCAIRDVERDVRSVYILGEANEVFSSPVVIGSDDSCEVVLDRPDVPARAVEFYPRGHHFYSRRLPDGEASRAGYSHRLGPFDVSAYYTSDLEPHVPTDLPVRFAARGLGATYAPSAASDRRSIEARRLLAAFADRGAHARVIDAELQAWCEDRVQIHFNSLTWATTPRRSLAHGRIIYATRLEDVLARFALAWSTVEALPFDRAAWAHVHRMDLWCLGLAAGRVREVAFVTALLHELPALSAVPEPLRAIATDLALLQILTAGDDVSPARPLAALLERGIVPVALPDGTLVLFVSGADASADAELRAELDFVAALVRDPDSRGVYADFLEQRGDAGQAQRVRAGATPSQQLDAQRIARRFDHAPFVLGDPIVRDREAPQAPPPRATAPPRATLELEGDHHALGIATHFQADGNRVRVVPADRYATIVYDTDGTLWLRGNGDIVSYAVNGRSVWRDDAIPLYDGDAIRITASYYRHGDTFTIDTTAILHAP